MDCNREKMYYRLRIEDCSVYGYSNPLKRSLSQIDPVDELGRACSYGHVNIARLFLRSGYSLRNIDLQIVFRNGDVLMIKLLEQFYPHLLNSNPMIFCQACRTGNIELVRKFLDQTVPRFDLNQTYCLPWACEAGQSWMVKFLIQYGADIHYEENISITLAHRNGHRLTVRVLLRYGLVLS